MPKEQEAGNEEKKAGKLNLVGWAGVITAVLTGLAALITAIGFPQFFPTLIQSIFFSPSPEPPQTATEPPELMRVDFVIFSRDEQPISQVEVRFIFDGAPAPRYTDSNGYVSIEIPERSDIEVVISKEGFQSNRRTLNLQADPNKTVTIYLESAEDEENLDSGESSQAENPNALMQGMSYDEARQILIGQGWQASIPVSNGGFPNLNNPSIEYIVRDRGYWEVKDCMGTGTGLCRFEFFNENGDQLIVTTSNNQPGQEIILNGWRVEQSE
jgi:hypothetical protein